MAKNNKPEELMVSFTKEQIVNSKKFAKSRDILLSLLDDDKRYTIAEIDKMIEDFLNKEVH